MTAPLLLALLLWGGPPTLPPRTPQEEVRMTELANALGQAHALRRLCEGEAENRWRSRMARLLAVEQADATLKQRLTDAFNAGFATGRDAYPQCSPESREALAGVERRAAESAHALAGRATSP